jgi:hypothetical protein
MLVAEKQHKSFERELLTGLHNAAGAESSVSSTSSSSLFCSGNLSFEAFGLRAGVG